MVEDSIVRETEITAPPERVWEVLTQAEYVGRWFGADKAEIDLRPGGSFVMTWAEHGVGLARVERVEEPALFSFRWGLEPGVEPKPGEEALVEFTLAPRGDGTLLTVVESGFSKLDQPGGEAGVAPRAQRGRLAPGAGSGRGALRVTTLADPGPVFAALADPTRRSVLTRLATQGAASATALARELPVTRQAVVQHLAVLDAAG